MTLTQFGNEFVSGQTDENKFTKVERLSKQFFVTNMQNIEGTPYRDGPMTELRLRQRNQLLRTNGLGKFWIKT